MRALRTLALILAAPLVLACDGQAPSDNVTSTLTGTSGSDATTGGNGSLTGCELGYAEKNASGKELGEGCTSDAECRYGECMLPGDTGNITNNQFGFCTRGCDCNGDAASQIPAELKEGVLECVYPSDGAGGLKDYHFVAIECANVGTCQALDSRWTTCELPDTGSARKVCHAL